MRILKIYSLPGYKTWIDRDCMMLHSCFQILQDFVEKEDVNNVICNEYHKKFLKEVNFLYKWWIKRKNDNLFDNDKKDNEMLNRLMKIRSAMWT